MIAEHTTSKWMHGKMVNTWVYWSCVWGSRMLYQCASEHFSTIGEERRNWLTLSAAQSSHRPASVAFTASRRKERPAKKTTLKRRDKLYIEVCILRYGLVGKLRHLKHTETPVDSPFSCSHYYTYSARDIGFARCASASRATILNWSANQGCVATRKLYAPFPGSQSSRNARRWGGEQTRRWGKENFLGRCYAYKSQCQRNFWKSTRSMALSDPNCHSFWHKSSKILCLKEVRRKNHKIKVIMNCNESGVSLRGSANCSFCLKYTDTLTVARAFKFKGYRREAKKLRGKKRKDI